jgi:hypothetical protein
MVRNNNLRVVPSVTAGDRIQIGIRQSVNFFTHGFVSRFERPIVALWGHAFASASMMAL